MKRRYDRLTVFILIILTFGLQVTRLGAQSLWYDEGFSAWLAARPVAEIVARTAADIHPPLYYLLLHVWVAGAGTSEFALRFPSVFAGVLAVPLVWSLGRRLLGSKGGLVAAALTALSPAWLWYAQEARMYTLVTTLGIASTWALLRLLDRPNRKVLSLYVLLLVLAVYTQYYAWFLVAAHVLFAGLAALAHRHRRPAFRLLTAGWAAALLAFLPWVRFVFIRLEADRSYWKGTLPFSRVVDSMLALWGTGQTAPPWLAGMVPLAALILVVGGCGALLLDHRVPRHRAWPTVLLLGAWITVPLVGLVLVSWGRPKYHPRYLLLTIPAYWLGVAALVGRLIGERGNQRRPLGAVAAAFVFGLAVSLSLLADANVYFNPAFTKDDWRQVARFLEKSRRPDEPILLVSGHAFPVFTYYYREDGWIPLPDSPTLDTSLVLGWAETARTLAAALNGARGVWLVGWQNEVVDPDQLVPMILEAAGGVEQPTPAFWGVEVRHWLFPHPARVPLEPPIQVPLQVNFDNTIRLLGWTPPETPVPADQGIPLTLFWALPAPTSLDLKVALDVVDEAGFRWGQLDRRPANYFHPTFRWRPGDVRPAEYLIPLQPGTPPGTYFIELTVYTDQEPDGLNVLDTGGAPQGRSVRLGAVRVGPPTRPVAMYSLPPQVDEHNVSLLHAITLLASRTMPGGMLEPGQYVPVALWWQAEVPPRAEVGLGIGWRRGETLVPAGDLLPPGGPEWPTSVWRAGELVLTQVTVRVPLEMKPGPASLVVWLEDEEGRRSTEVSIGTFEIVESQRSFEPPAPAHVQRASFGERIALVGYEIEEADVRPEGTVRVILYWQALAPMKASYKAFVHVLDGNGVYLAGDDRLPANGQKPTNTWLPGEYVRDEFTVTLPADLPPPPFLLEAGWYDPADPALPRLPAQGEGADGTRVLLRTRLGE